MFITMITPGAAHGCDPKRPEDGNIMNSTIFIKHRFVHVKMSTACSLLSINKLRISEVGAARKYTTYWQAEIYIYIYM